MANTHAAYCWRSGQIEIGDAGDHPEGTIIIARGSRAALEEVIELWARWGYQDGVYLVPGLPEATDEEDVVGVLMRWIDRAFAGWPREDGIPAEVRAA